ncbi:MAG: leucine-rich repeat domain-containing protein [Lachnospiraceae bacterium]|nr:leucine-rich repeat domain-containing protein [Lachnospiraceae bacterium]
MRRGTKIGWLLIAVSIMLSVWVIISTSAVADSTDYVLDGTTLKGIPSDATTIDIPNGVTTIAPDLFKNNANITTVNIPDSVTDLGTGFNGCTGLQTVTIGTGITTIGSDIFYNCTSLNTVNFPSTLTTISANAFRGCTGLKTITIPSGCTSVDPDAFNGCIAMVGFTGGSSAYSVSADNCLYSADGTTLVNVPDGKTSITIPSTCKAIADGAFNGSQVTSLTIPASVTSIGTQSTDWSDAVEEIWGESGSAAYEYAMTHDITFRTIGNDGGDDDNGDNGNGDNGGGNDGSSYAITAGANQSFVKGSGNAITVTGSGAYDNFSAVQIDGTAISSDYYSVASGSTVVTLNAGYLESLSEGAHTITIVWNDGVASTTLNVKPAGSKPDDKPDTKEYKITAGADATWAKGSKTTLSFTGSGDISELAGVKIDGTTTSSATYSATGSPTVITLTATTLESLTLGNHTITIVWTGGSASCNFTVASASTGYTITSGANSTWTKGSGTTLSFTGSGPLAEFAGIKMDGTTVGASNYSTTTSPTIITLSNAYLESLSVGTHSMTVVWTGGTATANFTIAAAGNNSTGSTSKTTTTTTTKTSTGTGTTHAKDNTPKTADGKLDPRYFLAFAIMLSGIAIVINGRGKQINYVNDKRNQ